MKGSTMRNKSNFLNAYWWDIRGYKDNPTEDNLDDLLWFIFVEGYSLGMQEGKETADYDI
jgi:hypothetical protein